MYVSPFAGYAVRVSYWLMQVIATGGQLVAASIYMAYWFPEVPGAVWVLAFALMLLYVNSRAVGRLGSDRVLAGDDQGRGGRDVRRAGAAGPGSARRASPAIGLPTSPRHGGFMPFGVDRRVARLLLRHLLLHRRRDPRRHLRRGVRSRTHDSARHAAHGARPVGDLHRDDDAADGADAVEPARRRREPLRQRAGRARHSRRRRA